MVAFFAHSANASGERDDLVGHLRRVAALASQFAQPLNGAQAAYYAGLWHDLGKFTQDFQQYLENSTGRRGPPHSHVGALLAVRIGLGPLAFVIAGHHAGLPARKRLEDRLAASQDSAFQEAHLAQEALENARRALLDLEPAVPEAIVPKDLPTGTSLEMFIRLLFSALVDADSLVTEQHTNPGQTHARAVTADLASLWRRLETHLQGLSGKQGDPVNRMRHEVYQRCLDAADGPRGFYRLTVPTGGGKTLSSMAFALRHALRQNLRRVIVAIPYTSIIDQNAAEYRKALGDDMVVLEHHSAVVWEQTGQPGDPEAVCEDPRQRWANLAAENWDAPIVVTTFVQLFESLLSNRRTACRKLHNITRSVVILDEVQTLPVRFLSPLLEVLRELVARYQVTVVLCSATLPAFGLQELGRDALPEAREIVPDYQRYFRDPHIQRVQYRLPGDEQWGWEQIATEVGRYPQCMVVLNTRPDAMALLDALGPDSQALHLSTFLCAAHRRRVLADVRRRLEDREPCRLVTTQVVEAGVDLDFPVVFRAVGPLDRIVQAAGRCNREGSLSTPGQVVVFEPARGRLPERSGPYHSGTQIARRRLATAQPEDLFDPDFYCSYFRELFPTQVIDVKGIQQLRERLDFPEVARRFRLIEDDTESVIVRYPPHLERVDRLLEQLRTEATPARLVLRDLQSYIVDVRRDQVPRLSASGLITEVRPGLWEWRGAYDDVRGIGVPQRGLDPATLVVG